MDGEDYPMTLPFVLIDKLDFDKHHFRVYEPSDS